MWGGALRKVLPHQILHGHSFFFFFSLFYFKLTNLKPFHSVTQPADDETVVLVDNILWYPFPESVSTISTHLAREWHIASTCAMELAVSITE